jgi:signal transduction histidine kinase
VQISRISSLVSHELRNPLSSVKMAVQTLARNTGLSEKDQRRLQIANKEIRTMERMLWLFSEYGRESASHGELAPLRGLVLEAAGLVELELAERRVRVEVEETAPCPKVRLDLARLRPVLAQLLLNVAMGQSEDSVVKVALTPEGGWTKLLVTDPQVVPPEEQATVFEPFGSLLARGAGLSLAALSRVMKSHGGRVTADSGAGPGTVYTLCFPAAA